MTSTLPRSSPCPSRRPAPATAKRAAPVARKPPQSRPQKPAAPAAAVRVPPLLPYLRRIPDPRSALGRRHSLASILVSVCLGMISGIGGYLPVAEWNRALDGETQQALGFSPGRTPAASTFYEVLRVVPWAAVEAQLRAWAAEVTHQLAPVLAYSGKGTRDPQGVALDGKTVRGSWKRGAEVAHLLALVGHQLTLTLAQTAVGRKQGELTALRELLPTLLLDGLVLTLDAQFTQRDLAERIVAQGGEYVMQVKGNQPTLLTEVAQLLSLEGYEPGTRTSYSTFDQGHGRSEGRFLLARSVAGGRVDWPEAQQIFVLVRDTRQSDGTRTHELQYGITSLRTDESNPERLLRLVRGHWCIESQVFWVKDVVMGEDRSSVETGNIVAVLAMLRSTVLGVLRASGRRRIARAIRELKPTIGPRWSCLVAPNPESNHCGLSVALNLGDYHDEWGALTVRSGRGRKPRLTYMGHGGERALEGWVAARGDAPGPSASPSTKPARSAPGV